MLFYGFSIVPSHQINQTSIIYYLRVNHLDYEMDLLNPLVGYNQVPKIDAVLHELAQVVAKKQESYVWGQKGLKLTSHAEQTAIEYQLPNDPTIFKKAIPTAWLVTLMWD
jgi:hypothetical protein